MHVNQHGIHLIHSVELIQTLPCPLVVYYLAYVLFFKC